MKSIVELHDSKVAEIVDCHGTVTVHFSPAYLHKSEGRPGVDPGIGWVQNARLVFEDASIHGGIPKLPCDVMDGELFVGAESYGHLIPVPLEVTTAIELRLVFDSARTVTVKGRGVRLELLGEPRYVEEFQQ